MLNLVWSPVCFFDARRYRAPDWGTALTAPALCAGLQGFHVRVAAPFFVPEAYSP